MSEVHTDHEEFVPISVREQSEHRDSLRVIRAKLRQDDLVSVTPIDGYAVSEDPLTGLLID